MHKTYCLLLLLMTAPSLFAQTYTEVGSVSGSGLLMLPSASIAPPAQFSLNISRIDFLRRGNRGINIYEMNSGFSSHLEGYLKFSAEDVDATSSVSSIGFGGKLQLPFSLPLVDRAAIWGEMNYSEDTRPTIFPATINRLGVMSSLEWQFSKTIFFLGVSGESNLDKLLVGAGYMIGLHRSLQLGSEFFYGYSDANSIHVILNGTYRIMPNITIHINPGYLRRSSSSTWLLAAGVSIATADIDFTPVQVQKTDEFHIPSFEEIEQQTNEEKQ